MTTNCRVALATALSAAGLDPDESLLLDALRRRGAVAEAVPWDGGWQSWDRYDLVVLRSTWDYPQRHHEFLDWVDEVAGATPVVNPPEVVRANTDKRYLARLADAGVPTVPTAFVRPGEATSLPNAGSYVVKPAVSAGSRDTLRCGTRGRARATALVDRLHAEGRTVMVQPYVTSVDERGETALIGLGGSWSHAVRKGPMLTEGADVVGGLFAPERLELCVPSAAERAVATAALDALGALDLLYARVDLVAGETGEPMVLEVELTEPSVFLRQAPGAADRFADAILRLAR